MGIRGLLPKRVHINLTIITAALILGMIACAPGHREKNAVVFRDPGDPLALFAAGDIAGDLRARGYETSETTLDSLSLSSGGLRIVLAPVNNKMIAASLAAAGGEPVPSLAAQGYAFRRTPDGVLWILGADSRGVMYGGFAVAEALRYYGAFDSLAVSVQSPFIAGRGLKFNIPLDARTPSFDDTGDAAQKNILTIWDYSFWEAYLDGMARDRYNMLSLWNPHPFPHLVKLDDYPDAALADVCVSDFPLTYEAHVWGDPSSITRPVLDNLRVVKQLSINEKIEFWRRVMRHAKDRGIDVYFITWNVNMNSVSSPGKQEVTYVTSTTPGKYGITDDQDNPKTIAYVRACTRALINTYPDLTGIGVTAGENMKPRSDRYDQIKWLWSAYGEGIMDAKRDDPSRTVPFIHRVWWGGLDKIMTDFAVRYPDPFSIGFKYSRAHLYSSTKPPFAAAEVMGGMDTYRVKCWWNLRNDDLFVLRWADPGYVREFFANMPPETATAGYHMGSDGYVWGREFVSHDPSEPRQLELDKQWLSFMLWGMLGYDNTISDDYFRRAVAVRMPESEGTPLFDAWVAASKIAPLVNRFHWRDWDFQWAVEGCFDQKKGFHTVDDFIDTAPMEGSGFMSIPDYVRALRGKAPMTGVTPVQVANELDSLSTKVREQYGDIRRAVPNPSTELRYTLGDIAAFGHMGRYYAEKIRAATALAMYRETGDEASHNEAVEHLQEALAAWGGYANVASALYDTQLLARTRRLDWMSLYQEVQSELATIKGRPVKEFDPDVLKN